MVSVKGFEALRVDKLTTNDARASGQTHPHQWTHPSNPPPARSPCRRHASTGTCLSTRSGL